jgi:prophage antirepressor-like protein
MDKDMKIFDHKDFGSVRIVMLNGDPWFVAKDVAAALGYANTREAINMHCKYLKPLGGSVSLPLEIQSHTTIIPEKDVYRLIMRSQLPSAEKFQDWVMDEVLPDIRKHGMYATDNFVEMALNDPDHMISVLTNYKFEKEKRQLAEKQRDEAFRTKAWINGKKTATAMATASVVVRENDRLKTQVGNSKNYKQVKAIPWLNDVFDLNKKAVYNQIGKHLTKICDKFGYDYRLIEDSKYGSIKAYHVDAIEHFRHRIIEDDLLMKKYRIDLENICA